MKSTHKLWKHVLLLGSLSPLLLVCRAAQAAIAPAQSQTLENGATLVTRSDKLAPRVSISLFIKAGAADESAQNAGWRQVLAGSMLRATKLPNDEVRSAAQWQQLAATWGGQIGASTGEDFIELWARGDSGFQKPMLEALLQIASSPRLAEEDIAWARRRALEIIGSPEGGVARRATQAIAGALYRDEQGIPLAYALPDYGSFDSLSNLSSEELRAFHQKFFVPQKFIASIAGDAWPQELRGALSAPAAAGSTPAAEDAPAFAPLKANAAPLRLRESEANGAWVFVGYRTPAPSTLPPADYAALRVLAAALGDSAWARLPRRLQNSDAPRDSKERAAQIGAQWTSRRYAGELVLLAQAGPENIAEVQAALLDEVKKLQNAPLQSNELQAAKNFARGTWAVERETMRERAFFSATAVAQSTFPDTDWPQNIAALTTTDIHRVARQYLQNPSVVLVLPEQ